MALPTVYPLVPAYEDRGWDTDVAPVHGDDVFGPYPYTELDIVETPNYLGGMEYSGLVVLEDGLYPGVSTVEWLTAHEVAHQWWMVVVGNDQINEPWLDEALMQYSTMLYYEAVYGEQRAHRIRNAVFLQTHEALRRAGRDMPAGLSADAYPPGLYFDIVYDKGALYFHELRERVGDELFFDTLRSYYDRHRYQIATTGSFLDTVEEVTGRRHEDLFEK
jgi:aminopeptidase N